MVLERVGDVSNLDSAYFSRKVKLYKREICAMDILPVFTIVAIWFPDGDDTTIVIANTSYYSFFFLSRSIFLIGISLAVHISCNATSRHRPCVSGATEYCQVREQKCLRMLQPLPR